ncbi:hypothetical protein LX32DRAFT_379801 [Colletotrichum zoysiae]|uniref:Uncharacterized protein n=1 Tax=Colletotrichum zoysiae TaxID=1216348 RepID=A0AAD9HIU2_9PEZI|nr:hypothetical protein LX32DRAFT_379801 [Colletotrichum zoysiae]
MDSTGGGACPRAGCRSKVRGRWTRQTNYNDEHEQNNLARLRSCQNPARAIVLSLHGPSNFFSFPFPFFRGSDLKKPPSPEARGTVPQRAATARSTPEGHVRPRFELSTRSRQVSNPRTPPPPEEKGWEVGAGCLHDTVGGPEPAAAFDRWPQQEIRRSGNRPETRYAEEPPNGARVRVRVLGEGRGGVGKGRRVCGSVVVRQLRSVVVALFLSGFGFLVWFFCSFPPSLLFRGGGDYKT